MSSQQTQHLEKVKKYLQHNKPYYPSSVIAEVDGCIATIIAEDARKYYECRRKYEPFTLLIARPASMPNTAWLEFDFPETANTAVDSLSFTPSSVAKTVGTFLEWSSSDDEQAPEVLTILNVVESSEGVLSPPKYAEIPIGMNGRMLGDMVLLSLASNDPLEGSHAEEIFWFFTTPALVVTLLADYFKIADRIYTRLSGESKRK